MTYFSQSFPDIKVKLKRLERRPLTPQAEVLAVAFKVYNGRDEKALKHKYQQKYQLMAKALLATAAKTHVAPTPKSLLQNVGRPDTGPEHALVPESPPRPCPKCDLLGHWGVDCPSAQRSAGQASPHVPDTDLLGLATED